MICVSIHGSSLIPMVRDMYRGFPKLGVPFWGPHNKDYSIGGLHWGPITYFGKPPYSNIKYDQPTPFLKGF